MKPPYRDIESLLKNHVDQQMQAVNWDRMRDKVDRGIAQAVQREPWRASWYGMVAAAAVIVLVVGGAFVYRDYFQERSLLDRIQAGVIGAGPMEGTDLPKPTEDALLACMDPSTILCAENVHVLTSDPLLQPHSVWDQQQSLTKTIK